MIKEKCKCILRCDCTNDACQCIDKCLEYSNYNTQGCYYFTVSPNPRDYASVKLLVREWISRIYKFSKQLQDFIIVFEFSGARPHLHGICRPLFGRKLGIVNTIFSWSRYSNAKLHLPFVKGLHYLFKEWKTTYDLIGLPPLDKNNIKLIYNDSLPLGFEPLHELFEQLDDKIENNNLYKTEIQDDSML